MSEINQSAETLALIGQLKIAQLTPSQLSDEQLLEVLEETNRSYREGFPIVDDQFYDHQLLSELASRNPEHSYLHQVEPEPAFNEKTVVLPQRMLSTDKAYTLTEMKLWQKRVTKAANELAISEHSLSIRITPKLDGYAAFDDSERLYTRGNGYRGSDISRAFTRGLLVGGDGIRGQGAGEIVINQAYFEQHLSDHFDNSRNFQAAILAEKNQDERVTTAIQAGAATFMPFKQLPSTYRNFDNLFDDFEDLIESVWNSMPYEVDGVIFEITDEALKTQMGATQHHHRWQIAFKINSEKAQVKVLAVHPQTSRSGRINPVVEIEPTRLSGVTIRNVTAHHYAMVQRGGIGAGTQIELVRSGMVIPKIEAILKPAEPEIPSHCPSCNSLAEWDSDFLICPNSASCPAQSTKRIEHFFFTLGNVDGFGDKTIVKLCEEGISRVIDIYQLDLEQLMALGFGEKTSQNLLNELLRSRTQQIQDWRFLAAFGIPRLGLGNSEQLLSHCRLLDIFDLTTEQIIDIEGFAEKTAAELVKGLATIKQDFLAIHNLEFNLQETSLQSEKIEIDSAISNKQLVFTGKMSQPREEMEAQAKELGAIIGKSVSSKTDFLITGENVGAKKIQDAEKKGVQVVSEAVYLQWL